MIYLEKCDKTVRKTCKPDKEVKEWLKDNYILLGYNQQLFKNDEFQDKKFEKKIWLDWLTIDINSPVLHNYQI